MTISNNGIRGQPTLPYVDYRSYAGADVFLDMTFVDHTMTEVIPTSLLWQLDNISDGVNMIAPSTSVPTVSTMTLQIPGPQMQMTFDWRGSQLCQFSGSFTAIDSVTGNPFTSQFIQIIELCAIQTPQSSTAPLPQPTLAVSLTTQTLTYSGFDTSPTTNSVTASVSGGSGNYSHSYAFTVGGTDLTINGAATATASVSGTLLAPGDYSGTMVDTVTDTTTGVRVTSAPISVSVAVNASLVSFTVTAGIPVGSLSLSASPTSVSGAGITTSITSDSTTFTPSGGGSHVVHNITWNSGGSGLNIDAPTSATTTVTASAAAAGTTYTGTLLDTVSDQYGQQATATVTASVQRYALPTVGLSSSTISYSGTSGSGTTNTVTATPAPSGNAPFTHSWAFTGGTGASMSINNASTDTASVSGVSLATGTHTATMVDTVTDNYGQSVSSTTVTVTIQVAVGVFVFTYGSTSGGGTTEDGYDSFTGVGSLVSHSLASPFTTPTRAASSFSTVISPVDTYVTVLSISAGSDPGSSAFTAMYCDSNPTGLTSASAHAYVYSGGTAQWTWYNADIFFGIGTGNHTVTLA